MKKNLVISILSAVIISGMDFWEFSDPSDRGVVAMALMLILFVTIVAVEDWIKERRMRRFRSERFWRNINEMQNRP